MSKEHRSNKEVRKPKKDAVAKAKPGAGSVTSAFAQPARLAKKPGEKGK